jgi:hypothetical protein
LECALGWTYSAGGGRGEPGPEQVEAYFEEATNGLVALHASFVSLTEMEYITIQRLGLDRGFWEKLNLNLSKGPGSGAANQAGD